MNKHAVLSGEVCGEGVVMFQGAKGGEFESSLSCTQIQFTHTYIPAQQRLIIWHLHSKFFNQRF